MPELSRFGGMLLVTFSTGEKHLFDTTQLKGSAFEPLKDKRIFSRPVLFHGVITWQNERSILPRNTHTRKAMHMKIL